MKFIAVITLWLSLFALGQDDIGITLHDITDSIALPETCIHGPLRIRWPNGPGIELRDEHANICVYLRGHIGFAVFGSGIYAYNEYGEFVTIFAVRNDIREFTYGVH